MLLFKMTITVSTLVFIICCSVISVTCQLMKPEFVKENRQVCSKIARNPFFDIDLVVGKPWRIYHTWNMRLDAKCLDMVIKNATRAIIKRIWTDMYEYLEQQPNWDAATLHITMGSAKHEMLLFADNGPAGAFLAVPNVIRDANINPMRNAVPLLKFQMKLLREGKFLLVMDCHLGGASLAARSDQPPYRSEIAAEVATLDIGDGYPACTKEMNKEEQFFVK